MVVVTRKQQFLQTPTATTTIEKFSHDGRGIARINGKITFIAGALPGETVSFYYTKNKADFAEGRVVSIHQPSPLRAEPKCAHYGICGGCSLQHLTARNQVFEKESFVLDSLLRIGHCQPEKVLPPLSSLSWHYRNKARLSVRYVTKKQSALVGFREKANPRYISEIDNCAILHPQVSAQIGNLRKLVSSLDDPRSIAQIEVAAGDEEVALIIRNLSPLSPVDEDKIRQFGEESHFRLFLQPGDADSVYLFYPPGASEFLSYTLPEENLRFQFSPNDFTQVNASLNRLMVKQALELIALNSEDIVLDLFCGLGNFSLPLAKYCHKLVGIEGSKAMVSKAKLNAQSNNVHNAEFFCIDLDRPEALLPFLFYNFTKILIDPPRGGALEIIKQMKTFKPKSIVYVSCNPATLARDADILVNNQGYHLTALGVMDMFPHTAHVEAIALFEKRVSGHG